MGIKKPKIDTGKNIKATNDNKSTKAEHKHPIFCFRFMHKDFNIDVCDATEKIRFLDRLCKLSTMDWLQIQHADRHGFGSEKIQIKSIKPNIPNSITPDVDYLLALRFDGNKPFLGYKSGSIFHIIFIDNKFSVYDH